MLNELSKSKTFEKWVSKILFNYFFLFIFLPCLYWISHCQDYLEKFAYCKTGSQIFIYSIISFTFNSLYLVAACHILV